MTKKRSYFQSLVTFTNSQGAAARGTLLTLDHTSVVIEVYNPYSIVQLSEVLHELTIRRGERIIYHGGAVVSSLVNTGLMLIVSVKLLDPWIGLSELIRENASAELSHEVLDFISAWEKANRLQKQFVLSVNRLRSFLSELSRWLGHLDYEYGHEDRGKQADLSLVTVHSLGEHLIPQMHELFQTFEYEASRIPVETMDEHKAFAQRDLHPLVLSSPFVHRTFSKPLGYAGDYEMMNMIQRDPADGPTVYSKILNTLFLQAPIPQSVRNRTDLLLSYLTSEYQRVQKTGNQFHALSVGCGPAIEVQRFIREFRDNNACDFTLLDFNKETLDYARISLNVPETRHSGSIDVHFVWKSVHDLLKQSIKPENTNRSYDFVYCSGLFDYLSDCVCSRLTRLFYSWVRPDGVVLVTNMHKSNPNKFIMDYLMEWYLIYRDETAMQAFCPALNNHQVFLDNTGVNVVLEVRKPSLPEK